MAKLSYQERSRIFKPDEEENIQVLNSKSDKFKALALDYYLKADKFARQLNALSDLKLQNDHSMIIYYAEVSRNRNMAIELSEKSLKAALEEVDLASNQTLARVKPIIDKL